MSKYFAINLGPISTSFSMARKPREFWAASYMFSFLMECILEKLDGHNGEWTLISPFYGKSKERTGVGLYPDRCFYLVDKEVTLEALSKEVNGLLDEVLKDYAAKVGLDIGIVKNYFCIMVACEEYETKSAAIKGLNTTLNYMELNCQTSNLEDFKTEMFNVYESICDYLRRTSNYDTNRKDIIPLVKLAFGKKEFTTGSLEDIAKANAAKLKYSRQKYVCIVQADGDGMGSIVTSEKMEGQLNDFSKTLMDFAKEACVLIKDFGGLPIYAGGDDLLFIVPVTGDESKDSVWRGRTVFDLLDTIDKKYSLVQSDVMAKEIDGKTSMSYGVAMIYDKYPLYEAWKTAAAMLFTKAKKVKGKNAMAVKLRKNSGSDLEFVFSKDSGVYKKIKELVKNTPKESIVSAVAHKVRASDIVLDTFPKDEAFTGLNDRLSTFFEKIVDVEDKSDENKLYMDSAREVLKEIFKTVVTDRIEAEEEAKKKGGKYDAPKDREAIVRHFYSMLRIAKFIKGEELKDE